MLAITSKTDKNAALWAELESLTPSLGDSIPRIQGIVERSFAELNANLSILVEENRELRENNKQLRVAIKVLLRDSAAMEQRLIDKAARAIHRQTEAIHAEWEDAQQQLEAVQMAAAAERNAAFTSGALSIRQRYRSGIAPILVEVERLNQSELDRYEYQWLAATLNGLLLL